LGKNVLVNKVVAGYIGIAHLWSCRHTDSGAKEMASSSDEHLRLTRLNRFDQTFGTNLRNIRIAGHVEGLVSEILSPAIRKTECYQQLMLPLLIQHHFVRVNLHPLGLFIRAMILPIRSALADPTQDRLVISGPHFEPLSAAMGHGQ